MGYITYLQFKILRQQIGVPASKDFSMSLNIKGRSQDLEIIIQMISMGANTFCQILKVTEQEYFIKIKQFQKKYQKICQVQDRTEHQVILDTLK